MLASLVIVLIVGITFILRVADSKAHLAAFADANEPFEVSVLMAFEPEAFHVSALQGAGRIVKIEGDRVHLRAVNLEQLTSLSLKPWIERLALLAETEKP